LPEKYSHLHDIFPIQLIEDYHWHEGEEGYLPMPNFLEKEEE
jgi:hypothetical protein